MKLAVITPTCRREPRFDLMAQTIAANAALGHFESVLWIVVDDRLWDPEAEPARRQQLADAIGTLSIQVVHVPPKPSPWRGPSRTTDEDLPDHNGARNTGLNFAGEADYIFFLDDCSVITKSTFTCLTEAAKHDACLRVPWFSTKAPLPVPPDGRVALHETGGLHLANCSAMTVAGGCFGAPKKAFADVGGFDEIYSGTRGKNDLDIALRMERFGYKWLTSRRCASIQLNKTHSSDEVSKNQKALSGIDGTKHWNALLKDRRRFLPVAAGTDVPSEEFMAQGTPAETTNQPEEQP